MSISAFSLTGTVEVNTRQAEQGLKNVDQKAQALHSRFAKTLPNPFKHLGAEARKAEADIARVNAKMKASSGNSVFGSVLGANVATVGITALTAALGTGGRAVLEYSGRLEQLKIGFSTLLGSTQAAETHLKQLEQFAAKTPFEFEQVARASQRFHNMGLETKKVIPLLTSVGDAVAAAGGNAESIDRVTSALAQMTAKSKVSAEEMNQLAEAGVGGWRILEQQLGITKAQAIKLAEQGKISSEVFLDAFQKFSKVNFGGAMEKQSKTFQGAMSTIKDTLLTTAATAFEPLFKKISEITSRISQELQSGKPSLERSMRALMEGLGEVAAQSGVFLGQQIAKGITDGISNFSFNPAEIFKRFQPITYGVVQGLINSAVDASAPAGMSSQTQSDLLRMGKAFSRPAYRTPNFSTPKNGGDSGSGLGGDGGGGRRGGGGGGGSQRDVLEGIKTSLVDLNAEYRKYDAALLGSANRSALAAEKEKILADVMSALGTNTRLAISGLKDVDAAIEKAIGALPKKSQAAARALVEQSLAQGKVNEETRRAGLYADQTKDLFDRFRNAITDTRLGTDEYTVAIRDLQSALAKQGITLEANTRIELEHQAALQKTLALTRQRFAFARERDRLVERDRPLWIDLGGGSTVGGEVADTERPRYATLDNQVMQEEMARRTAELRNQLSGLANDITGIFDNSLSVLIKAPGTFAEKMKEAFREVGLGFADMLQQMASDLLRSQVLKLLERVAGINSGAGSGGNGSINLLGGLSDRLLEKLGLGKKKPKGAMPDSRAQLPDGKDSGGAEGKDTDRILNGQEVQTAQLGQQIQSGADRIIEGLTPQRQSFLSGLAGAVFSGALSGLGGALTSRLTGGGRADESGGNRAPGAPTGTPTPWGNEPGRPVLRQPVPRRALGGSVSANQTYLVGEQGAELLHMGGPGSISPNNKLTPNQIYNRYVTVNLTQQIHTNDPQAFQRSARQNARAARGALSSALG
jgi:tape measure domain-containing protein